MIAASRNQTMHNANERNKQMKIRYAMLGVTAGTALFLAVGCSKEEPPAGETPKAMNPAPSEAQKAPAEPAPVPAGPTEPTPPPAAPAKPAPPAAATVPVPAAPTAPAMPAAATQAVAAAAAAASATSAQAQGLIDKAKGLVTDQKYQEALTLVQQLSSLKLTPEQQTLVDSLKAQIQTAMAKSATSNAASALGNILGGKK